MDRLHGSSSPIQILAKITKGIPLTVSVYVESRRGVSRGKARRAGKEPDREYHKSNGFKEASGGLKGHIKCCSEITGGADGKRLNANIDGDISQVWSQCRNLGDPIRRSRKAQEGFREIGRKCN